MAPELADVRVRQALNYAFDREAMLTALQSDHGTVTTQVFPASSDAYDPELDEFYTYDPEKAKDLLAEAGFADGFTLSMPSSPLLGATTYTLISQQLEEIGITAEYTEPGQNFIADLLAPKFPASYMALEQNPDWQLIQFMIAPTAIFNPFHTEDDTVNQLISEIQFGDEATQAEKAKELNKYIVEQAWFAPFYRVRVSSRRMPTPKRRCSRRTRTPRSTTSSPRTDDLPARPPVGAGGPGPNPDLTGAHRMLTFIIRRILAGIVLLFVISFVAFLFLYAGSGDIARKILGQNATAETVQQKATELGLDRPTPRAVLGLADLRADGRLRPVVVHGPARDRQPLQSPRGHPLDRDRGHPRLGVLSVLLGVLAARRGGGVDGTVQFISMLGFAIPGFLVALYLVLIFAINLGWFKATGYIPLTTSFAGWLSSSRCPSPLLRSGRSPR